MNIFGSSDGSAVRTNIRKFNSQNVPYYRRKFGAALNVDLIELDTNQPTPWRRVLLEKPPVVQLLKNFPIIYETRRFITVFTRALYWSLSCAR
jgi:hypothetical protein